MQSIVDEMLPKGKAAEFNEGMMELGASLCKPTNPKCDICPVKNNCRSRISNDILSYPVKNKKNKIPHLIVSSCHKRSKKRIFSSSKK